MTETTEGAKEHPIIFNGWSSRRILAGEKTQTRRVIKPQAHHYNPDTLRPWVLYPCEEGDPFGDVDTEITCPYGQPGDVLWCREAFQLPAMNDSLSPSEYLMLGKPLYVRYEADGAFGWKGQFWDNDPNRAWGRKRPSIHMPKELCRLRLRVEDVGVERLQEITLEAVKAEGIPVESAFRNVFTNNKEKPRHKPWTKAFKQKWNDLHDEHDWETNPWVWKISFSVLDSQEPA